MRHERNLNMLETKEFQTESKKLLDLMINSIYSEKEIFLRELISNGSDAIDKYRYLSLTEPEKYPFTDFIIRLNVDKKNRFIEIIDNGIGMSKDDIIVNLGTIAKSGSKDFLTKIEEAKKADDFSIIGQFGVGFYSAFMVAEKVEVISKPVDGPAHIFSSDGRETYTIDECEYDQPHGTLVRVYLKPDEKDGENFSAFLEQYRIKSLVKKYSDYVRYPIKMLETRSVQDVDAEGKPVEGKYHDEVVDSTLNSMVPLWKKNPSEVKEEDLFAFYKSKTYDQEDPLLALNLQVDGLISYSALIFVPAHAPYNLYSENYEKGLTLYSKGIFIQDKCKELVPDYLKFISGLVDSDSLPLNISREMLQKSTSLSKIADSIEKKVIDRLKTMLKNDREKYEKFFNVFGDHIKFGIYSSYGIRAADLQDLLLFHSMNKDSLISLAEYVKEVQKDQKVIYYASGKTLEEVKMLPQLEAYRKKGVDVLLFDKNIDEFAIQTIPEYEKLKFVNIASESKEDLTQEEKDEIEKLTIAYKRILDNIKEALAGKVDDVAFSAKLVDSPVCITTKEGLSLNMEHVLAGQPGAEEGGSELPKAIKVLEINGNSDLFKAITALTSDEDVKKYGALLYNEALLLEGYDIEDKKGFVQNLNELMMKAMGSK